MKSGQRSCQSMECARPNISQRDVGRLATVAEGNRLLQSCDISTDPRERTSGRITRARHIGSVKAKGGNREALPLLAKTKFGQTKFDQHHILVIKVGWEVQVGAPKGRGPQVGPKGGGPKFSLLFSLSHHIFFYSFFPHLGILSWNFGSV